MRGLGVVFAGIGFQLLALVFAVASLGFAALLSLFGLAVVFWGANTMESPGQPPSP